MTLLDEQQQRLCAYNIAACQAFKANPPPPPAPPQKDYKARALAAPLPIPMTARRERQRAKFAAKVEAKYGRKFEPVRMTALVPCPTNSASLVDADNCGNSAASNVKEISECL